jgi:hypothetical protein
MLKLHWQIAIPGQISVEVPGKHIWTEPFERLTARVPEEHPPP